MLPFVLLYCLSVTEAARSHLQCNYIDLGFNVVQPVNECVITKSRGDTAMSMGHFCVDGNRIESRVWATPDCSGHEFEVANTFDCNSNSSFVECDCQFGARAHSVATNMCTTITDIQYAKRADGGCDTNQVTEYRQYITDSEQCPDSFLDSNCFQRSCHKQS